MAKTDTAAPAGELLPLLSLPADLQALIDLGRTTAVNGPIDLPDGSVGYILGEGMHVEKIDALNPKLKEYVTQAKTFVEPKSFIDYLIQFKSPTAICDASLGQNKIVAVLDYHGRGRETTDAAVPGRAAHVVTLNCPWDVDYEKWRGIFGRFIEQKPMIEFIEDMIHTIGSPPAADLIEAMGNVEIERVVKFRSAHNDRNGNIRFTYDEQDGGTGEFSLPDHVDIVVPIFQGGNPVQLTAKLRHRMKDGTLVLGFAVPGIQNKEREAFRSIGEGVRTDTNTPVFYTA